MATGDYLVRRNNANTDTIPTAGSDLLLLWDTAVISRGSSITYSAGTFTLGELGRYLVLASDQEGTTDTTNNERINTKMTFNLGGTELQEGYSTGYIRKSGGSQEAILNSMAIIEVTSLAGGANDLQIRKERTDNSTSGSPARIADRSGITILKLDDNLNYGRYSGTVTSSTTGLGVVEVTLDTTVEEDGVVFSRTGNDVAVTTSNRVLMLTSFKRDEANTNGTRAEVVLHVQDSGNGNANIENMRIQTYVRGSDNCYWGGNCAATVIEPASGAEYRTVLITGGTSGAISHDVDFMMVELPSDCKAAKLQRAATSGSPSWNLVDTQFNFPDTDFIDTDTFTASTPSTDLTVDVDGPFLAFSNFATRNQSSATRAVPANGLQVNDVTQEVCGGSSYCRNNSGNGYPSAHCGTILDLTTNDVVSSWMDRIGTNSGNCAADAANLVMIEVDSFAPPLPPGTIVGDVTYNVVPASTMVVDIQTNPGDYLIRRNASNTDQLPDAGASLDLLWDTEVATKGSIAGYNVSTGEFTFYNTGKYLVLFSDQFEVPTPAFSAAEDRCWAQEVYIGGTRQQPGASSGWIYNDSGLEAGNPSSCSIIDITAINGTANVMKLVAERVDTFTGTDSELDRVADRSGVMIIKLDDTLTYAHYESSADFNTSTGQDAETTANIQTTVEDDGTVFSRTIDVVTVASSNLILGVMTIKTVNAPNSYEEFIGRVELNSSTDIPGSVSVMNVPANRNGSEWGHQSIGFVFEPDGNDTVRIRMATQQGGNGTFSWRASLQLLELPSTVKGIIVEATNGNFNPNSATNFAWDTNPYIDTDTFTHTVGTAPIEVDSAGDYLVFTSQANNSNTSGVTNPGVTLRENTTDINYAGNATPTFQDFGKDHTSPHLGALLTDLVATDEIFARNVRLNGGTGTHTCDIGAMTVLKLDTLTAPGGTNEYTIDGDVTYTFSIDGTMVEGRVLDGDSSITLTPNGVFEIGRSFAGDSSIVFSINGQMVEGRGIFGNSSIVFTPTAAFDYTRNASIAGDSSIVFNIASGMQANVNASIDGDSSITLTPDSPTHLVYSLNGASLIVLTPASSMVEGRTLDGDSSIVLTPASGMEANINAAIDGDSSIVFNINGKMVEGRGISGDSSIVFNVASGMAFNQNPSITGDSDIVLTPASTMVEGRALDGDSSIVFNIASGMVANINAAIDGDSSIVFNINGKMVEGRGIFGDSSIVFTPAADFEVGYTFNGDSSIVLTPDSATSVGRELAGDSSITLTPASTMIEGRVLNGDSSIVFNIAADLQFNSGNTITGDSSIVLTPTADLAVGREFTGASDITFSINGKMVEGRGIFGDSSIVFTPAADFDFTSSNTIQGDVTIVLSPESDTAVGYTLSGDSAIVLTPTADTAVERTVDGDSTITLTANSAFSLGRAIAGDSSITLTPDSATSVGRELQGDSAITFDINANFEFVSGKEIVGDSSITLTPEATVVKGLSFVGDSSITLTPDSALGFGNEIEGDSSITVTPASEMRVGRVRIGDSTITLTPNGEFDITRNPAINGDSSIILVPAADMQYIPERGIVGMSTIVITPKTFFPLPSFCIEVDNVETITIDVSNVDTQSIGTANNTLPSVLVANNELVSIESIPDIINIKSIDD